MKEELVREARELERAKIIGETAKISWLELQRFFAAGKVFRVDDGLDLVEVACAMQRDDVTRVGDWTARGWLAPVSDDQARQWVAAEQVLWAVAIKPWVLVQEPKRDD